MVMQWSIQRAAAETGLSADTLRYYEKIGLLPGIARSESGHRRFSEDDLGWIRFLQRLRATGMPIEQILRYGELMRAGDHTAAERRQILESHRQSITREIGQLEEALDILDRKIAHYDALTRGEFFDCETDPLPRRRVRLPSRVATA
jgi:DNA-binding transcriptional MerR regulator